MPANHSVSSVSVLAFVPTVARGSSRRAGLTRASVCLSVVRRHHGADRLRLGFGGGDSRQRVCHFSHQIASLSSDSEDDPDGPAGWNLEAFGLGCLRSQQGRPPNASIEGTLLLPEPVTEPSPATGTQSGLVDWVKTFDFIGEEEFRR